MPFRSLLFSMLAFLSGVSVAQEANRETLNQLPTGTLRAVYIDANAAQAVRDPATGRITGVAADLSQELATRLEVSLMITGVEGVQGVIQAVASGSADIGFLANDPSRRGPIEFSQTYLRNPQTILTPANSRLASIAAVKESKWRIGVTKGDSVALFLARNYPNVELQEIEGTDLSEIQELLMSGSIDGFAANRLRLTRVGEMVPGVRLLPGSLFGVPQAIVVRAGNTVLLEYLNKMIDETRANGFLQRSIESSGNGTEVEPAP